MAKEHLLGQMEENIQGSGLMENKVEKVFMLGKMERKKKGNGKMEKD